jgi:hypothetical protein
MLRFGGKLTMVVDTCAEMLGPSTKLHGVRPNAPEPEFNIGSLRSKTLSSCVMDELTDGAILLSVTPRCEQV